jgi:long-chain acyl-CoA synthetase
VVPDFERLKLWCETHQIHWTAPQFMVVNHKVEQLIWSIILEINKDLQTHERVRQMLLLHEAWTIASGEMSPSLKPRRPMIEANYQKEIDELYLQGL